MWRGKLKPTLRVLIGPVPSLASMPVLVFGLISAQRPPAACGLKPALDFRLSIVDAKLLSYQWLPLQFP